MTRRRGSGSHGEGGGAGGEHRRADRVAAEIQRVLSDLLLRRSRDPRLATVAITAVRVTPDLRHARVFYALMDGSVDREAVASGLEHAAPFLRRGVGEAVALRYVPELGFEFDRALAGARRIDALLHGIDPDASPGPTGGSGGSGRAAEVELDDEADEDDEGDE